MTTLSKLQQEARDELDELFPIDNAYTLEFRRLVDSLTARVYAAALDAVESGMPPPLKEPQHARIMKPDGHLESKYTWNKHRQAVLSHLRTLREGITGNEKI